MDHSIVNDIAATAAQVPPDIALTMMRSAVIAGAIRGIVAVLRTPLFGAVWYRGPWWLRPVILMALTAGAALFDALALGQSWWLAIGSAITGLGAATVSHDWQSIWSKANAVKKAKAAGMLDAPAEMDEPDIYSPGGGVVALAPAVVAEEGQVIPAAEGP